MYFTGSHASETEEKKTCLDMDLKTDVMHDKTVSTYKSPGTTEHNGNDHILFELPVDDDKIPKWTE